ncbi:hypothetical protein FA95DRAFT_1611134 [Auriscalpium vulgare]|uniref:Uncharacterized protein n=1 Tax=Auriscalpium vulgare TaxID=40419 RepID=A0ACB8RBD7_9AGAM|nr:hypothetical protein FA95DRAFT_1611134 [Auriscalpium vulgare]
MPPEDGQRFKQRTRRRTCARHRFAWSCYKSLSWSRDSRQWALPFAQSCAGAMMFTPLTGRQWLRILPRKPSALNLLLAEKIELYLSANHASSVRQPLVDYVRDMDAKIDESYGPVLQDAVYQDAVNGLQDVPEFYVLSTGSWRSTTEINCYVCIRERNVWVDLCARVRAEVEGK